MPHPIARHRSSRTGTTIGPKWDYTNVSIEPSKRPLSNSRGIATRYTTPFERKYTTVLIEPPRKLPPKVESTTKGITSEDHLETKPTASRYQPSTEQVIAASYPEEMSSHSTSSSPQKHTVGPYQPDVEATSARTQSSKQNLYLDVIRIPCDGSPLRISHVPLIKLGDDGVRLDECVALEEWLELFPNMWSLHDKSTFNYYYRKLLGLPSEDPDDPASINYFIYVCYEKEAGLAHNKYLESLSGVKVYGDGFFFKMREDFDVNRGPSFIHMGTESVKDLEDRGDTETTFRKVLKSLR